MGSASSRIDSRPPRRRPAPRRRLGIAACLCGTAAAVEAETEAEASAPSSSAPTSIDYGPSGKLTFRARIEESIPNDGLHTSGKDSSVSFCTEKGTSSSMTEDIRFMDSMQRNNSTENSMQVGNADCLPENVSVCEAHSVRTSSLPSTSMEPSHLELRSMRSSFASPLEVGNLVTEHASVTAPLSLSSSIPQFELIESANEIADSPSLNGPIEQRDENELPADLSSVSATLPNASGETSIFEGRRYSRRLFWDALSRRISRRNIGSSESLLSAERTSSRDRWLFDFNGHMSGDDLEEDSISSRRLRRRRHGLSSITGSFRSEEIRERIQSGLHDNNGETTYCPSGIHLEGTCSCNTPVVAEGSNTRASFARIVMLAEALFEVLDEIHRQPGALGLSAVSLPAPDFIVNSLPLRVYKKHDSGERADDNEQCYICLSEYEEGESIRVLPCRHEYHMSCVDKWLKEIHGVCPLCRGNVGSC